MHFMKKTYIFITLFLPLIFLSGCFSWEKTPLNWDILESSVEAETAWETKTRYILALWDSLTAWYALPIEDSYPSQLEGLLQENGYDYEFINGWVSGNTSAQALQRLDLYLEDEENLPEIAIVVLWWNDWLQWKSIDTLKDNLIEITERLQEKWVTVVLWWMQIPPNRWLSYFLEFKGAYKDVAKKTDAELIWFFLEDVATKWVYNLPDWIHPNKDWYEIIAKNTFNFLKKNKLITND